MWWARTTRLQLSARLSEHWLGATSAFGWGFAWGFEGDEPPSPPGRGEVRAPCAYLKCSEPFLETCGWLDWGDASSLLPLTVGCSDVAKCGGCGWTWDNSCWAVIEGKSFKTLFRQDNWDPESIVSAPNSAHWWQKGMLRVHFIIDSFLMTEESEREWVTWQRLQLSACFGLEFKVATRERGH